MTLLPRIKIVVFTVVVIIIITNGDYRCSAADLFKPIKFTSILNKQNHQIKIVLYKYTYFSYINPEITYRQLIFGLKHFLDVLFILLVVIEAFIVIMIIAVFSSNGL